MKARGRRRWSRLLVAVVLLGAIVLWNPFFELHRIRGASMWPLFEGGGEIVLVWKMQRAPRRGELVVLQPDDASPRTWLKRVVGLGGECVKIENGDALIGPAGSEPSAPAVRTVDDIVATAAPLISIPRLREQTTGDVPGLVDAAGRAWFTLEKGEMALSEDGHFLRIGDARRRTELRCPEGSLTDDHLDGRGQIVRGTHVVRDVIISLELYAYDAGAVLEIEQWLNGARTAVLTLELAPTSVRVRCNGDDACVVAVGGGSRVPLRFLLADRLIALATQPPGGAGDAFETVFETARAVPAVLDASYLRLVVARGSVTLAQLDLLRDIHYTSDLGEARYAIDRASPILGDNVFVLGDNSPESDDSRRWGDLHQSRIVGRPIVLVWPPRRARVLE
jgi:hypothetical protein